MLAKEDKYSQWSLFHLLSIIVAVVVPGFYLNQAPHMLGIAIPLPYRLCELQKEIYPQLIRLPISGIIDQFKFLFMTFNFPT